VSEKNGMDMLDAMVERVLAYRPKKKRKKKAAKKKAKNKKP
jgi:hypothetical protein